VVEGAPRCERGREVSSDMLRLLRAFKNAHGSAWLFAQNDRISDALLGFTWSQADKAEQALVMAIEKLEAAAAHSPRTETIS